MKNVIGIVTAMLIVTGIFWANLFAAAGDKLILSSGYYLDSSIVYYSTAVVGTTTQVTFSSTTQGIQRIFENQGNGNIMMSLSSSTIPTGYLTLEPGEKRIMDKYFGKIYMKSVDQSNTVQCEYINSLH